MVKVMTELVKPLQVIKSESDEELEENEEFAPTPEPEEPPAAKRQRFEEYLPRVSLGGGQEGNPPLDRSQSLWATSRILFTGCTFISLVMGHVVGMTAYLCSNTYSATH